LHIAHTVPPASICRPIFRVPARAKQPVKRRRNSGAAGSRSSLAVTILDPSILLTLSGERPKSIIHTFSAIIEQHRRLSLMRYFIFVSTRIIICNAFSLRRQTSAIHDLERLELSRCDCKIPLVKCSLVFVSRSPITGKLNSLLLHVRLGKERSLPEPRTQQARRTFVPNPLLPQPCSASFRCQIELNVPHPRGFHFACILSITTAVISNRDTHLETYNVRQSPGTLQHSV
jgi:hypothetical protein